MVGSGIPGVHDDRIDYDYRITPTRNGWKVLGIMLTCFLLIGIGTMVMIWN